MKITEISVRRRVSVAMVYVAVTVFGLVALDRMPVDLMPELTLPALSVITVYAGAAAPDVEDKVTKPLEEMLGSIGDLEELSSTSRENLSVITLRFAFGTDIDRAADDMRQALELAKMALPDDAEQPILFQFDMSQLPIMILTVSTTEGDIFDYREYVEDRIMEPIERVPGVGSVQMFNAPEHQILVEVDREALEAKHLTLQHIVDILKLENVTVPAGRLDLGKESFPVRMPAELESLDDIRDVVLMRTKDGQVRLRDVAKVSARIQETNELAEGAERDDPAARTADGKWQFRKSIVLMVMKQSDANTAAVAEEITRKLDELRETMPSNMRIAVAQDMSQFIVHMIENLSDTVLVGGLLVILVALLFLRRFRASAIVALSIPGSMIVAFLVLYMMDYTLNMVSLMAMSLAIGMVVDNAIVVLENITRHVERGVGAEEAAIQGTSEVGPAIVASTLTTVSIFAPLIFVSGLVGVMFGQLALVMTITIGASLVTGLVMTPTLCSRFLKPIPRHARGIRAYFQRRRDKHELTLTERVYARILRWAVRHRYATVLLAIGAVAGTVLLVGQVGFDFMPQGSEGTVQIVAELPKTYRKEEAAAIGRRIAGAFLDDPETVRVFYRAGTSQLAFASALGGKEGANVVQVQARLTRPGERVRTDREILDSVREKIKDIPEVVRLNTRLGSMISGLMSGMGKPVTIEILGDDYSKMEEAAHKVHDLVRETAGTVDATVDLRETREEILYDLDRGRAASAMVPALAAGGALRTALYGQTAGKYTGEGESLDILVRMADKYRQTKADIARVQASSMTRAPVSLSTIGEVGRGESPVEIRRKDKRRIVTVGADVANRALGDIAEDLEGPLDQLRREYPGLTIRFGGNIKEQKETFEDLVVVLLLGFMLVYMVMAGQFEALLDPLIIMFSVPFAVTGAFLALIATGTTLSMPAFLGLVILLGIVVNNAIVLIDYINLMRSRGMELEEAIVVGGSRRLRPVLMTALTTVVGMLPLAFATGEGAETYGPMGRSVVGGLLVSTFVTLVLVPAVYRLTEPLRGKFKQKRADGSGGGEKPAPPV